jgi:PAS domain S-box-containing protein
MGVGLTVLLIVGTDVAVNFGLPLKNPGWSYLILISFLSYWSGLASATISICVILTYLETVSYIPGSAFRHTRFGAQQIADIATWLTIFAVVIGTVQRRMVRSAIQEYDAISAANIEAQERQSTEAALQSSEGMWRLVVGATMDAIVVMREDGTISLWNERAEAMFGWSAAEATGQTVADTIIPPSYREAHRAGMRRFLETGEEAIFGKHLELTGYSKEGREFPVELSVVCHRSSQDRVFVGFIRDISEYKKLNERLRQAQRMEAIGTLAGGIAHDFNNVIAAIAGNTALARAEAPSDHAIQESLAEIEKAVARATNVVRQILTFSRSQESRPTAIDVKANLSEAIKLLRVTLPANIEMVANFDEPLPAILADTTDMHQIVLNLGINAAHAMRATGGRIDIQASSIELDEETATNTLSVVPGRYVRLSIADTGIGMDAQTRQRIFEPFFTTKEVGEGTGLGLSVVYGIVERLGGAISVYSEVGKGTVFHLYLPITEDATIDQEVPAKHALAGHAERILYVDDDEALVFMMTRMLRRLNYEVKGFQHPAEALQEFSTNPTQYDVLITDMSMPQLDGPDLVTKVREIRHDLPIVMVTGYIRPEDIEKARDLGVDNLVLKPNTVQEMSEVLSGILGRKANVAAPTPASNPEAKL